MLCEPNRGEIHLPSTEKGSRDCSNQGLSMRTTADHEYKYDNRVAASVAEAAWSLRIRPQRNAYEGHTVCFDLTCYVGVGLVH